jgi:hypothetical protein
MGGKNTSVMVAELRQLMMSHGILYAIVVVREGGVTEIGEKAALEYPYIANDFLRNPQGLFEGLDGMILPQLTRQGRVWASIHKPRSDLVVGLFSNSESEFPARYELAEQVDRQLTLLAAVS